MSLTCSHCGKDVAPGCGCVESMAAAAAYAVEVTNLRADVARLTDELNGQIKCHQSADLQVAALREALAELSFFGPADGTHGACLECGQSDIVGHSDDCQVGYFIARKLASSPALAADSATWPYVLAFARLMEAKLAENRHKGDREGWIKDPAHLLLARVFDELVEVGESFAPEKEGHRLTVAQVRSHCLAAALALREWGPFADFKPTARTPDELADSGNFHMMLADVCGGLRVGAPSHGGALAADVLREPSKMADDAIGLFLEYRDQHGCDEPTARAKAVCEVMEGGRP